MTAPAAGSPTREDPSDVHDGPHFRFDAIHLCEPSPQRTPVLFQAGASKRGRDFAARHAECVFINGPSKKVIGGIVSICARGLGGGTGPADLVIFTMMTVITDTTARKRPGQVSRLPWVRVGGGRAGADVRLDRGGFRRHGARTTSSGSRPANAQTSALEAFTTADPGPQMDGA